MRRFSIRLTSLIGRGALVLLLTNVAGPVILSPALAYQPGTGTLYSDSFEGTLDEDWEQGNGFGEPSPWLQVPDGGDTSFNADGYGPYGGSPTEHWARHPLHPVHATGFAIALEYRSELGAGYHFDLEVEQRAPALRRYRLRIDGAGRLSLWRSEGGVLVEKTGTADGMVPANQKRWLRLALAPGQGSGLWVRARLWDGGAAAEPVGWTLEYLDDQETIERVHHLEILADGPQGVDTWVDDLDAWGDPGSGVLSTIDTIHVVELSHVDIGFDMPPDEMEEYCKSHIDQVLANLDSAPDYHWTLELGWCLDRWWERSDQIQQQHMIDHLRGDRLTLAAQYTNLATTLTGHEELPRAIYWSSTMGREHDFPVRLWITDDVPGSTFALPEVLARAGLEYYLGGMNAAFGGDVNAPGHGERPFWWVGPDGSRVLAWHTFDSYAEGIKYGLGFFDQLPDLYRKLGYKLPEYEGEGYPWTDLLWMRGFDAHYSGFRVRNLVNQWNATYDTPVFVLSTAEKFLDYMLATHGPEAFPSYSGDYGSAWTHHWALAQHIQTWVREGRRTGRSAEALLAAGSSVDGQPVPRDRIDLLWRRILEVDDHAGAGSWPGYMTEEEMDRNNRIHVGFARDARDISYELLGEGLDRTVEDLPAAGNAVAAINPLGRERDGWVRIELPADLYDTEFRLIERGTGEERPFQRFAATREILFRARSVPAVGYRVYDLVPGTPTAVPQGQLDVTSRFIENDFYRLEVDRRTGAVTSLYHQGTGRELVDGNSSYEFNELARNSKQQFDLRNPPVADPPDSASVEVVSSGPLLGALRVTRTGTPHVETVYRLYRGEDRVEIENVLDRDLIPYVSYTERIRAYTVTLPFDVHDFELRTETATRFLDPVNDGFDRDSVFDWHNAPHTIAFWDDNLGILYAADAVVSHWFETLSTLTSPAYTTGDGLLLPRLKDQGDEYEFAGGTVGPYELEPDTSPLYPSVHHVRARAPGFDPDEANRFGFEALSPLRARLLGRRPGNLPPNAASFFQVDLPGVLLYTVKVAEDGDGVVLRLSELTGQERTVHLSSDVLELTDPLLVEMDEEGGVPLVESGGDVLVPLMPYETATVRVRTAVSWGPIILSVAKGGADVQLSWTGGVSPYTLWRSIEPAFAGEENTLADEEEVTAYMDPVLGDGQSYFYLVR